MEKLKVIDLILNIMFRLFHLSFYIFDWRRIFSQNIMELENHVKKKSTEMSLEGTMEYEIG